MAERRYQIRLDEDTQVALRRLACAEERTMAAQLRIMIRREPQTTGLWTPARPLVVTKTWG